MAPCAYCATVSHLAVIFNHATQQRKREEEKSDVVILSIELMPHFFFNEILMVDL